MFKRVATAVLLLTVAACAAPRFVQGIISTEQRVRFVHGDGIVQCDTPNPGEAKNCRDLNITYGE